jgi:hypothetical protein
MNLYTICTLSDTFWTTLASQPGSMLCAEEMSSRSWAMFKARSKSRLNAQWPDCAKTRTKTGQAMYGGDILWFYVALVCHRPSFKIRQPMNSPSTSCPGLNAGELLLLAHPFAAMWCSSKSGGAAAQLPVSMAYSTEVSTSSKPLFQLGICQNARAPEWFMSIHALSRAVKSIQTASPSTCTAWVQQCDRLQEEASKPNAMTLTLQCVHIRCPVQSGLPWPKGRDQFPCWSCWYILIPVFNSHKFPLSSLVSQLSSTEVYDFHNVSGLQTPKAMK